MYCGQIALGKTRRKHAEKSFKIKILLILNMDTGSKIDI